MPPFPLMAKVNVIGGNLEDALALFRKKVAAERIFVGIRGNRRGSMRVTSPLRGQRKRRRANSQ